MENIKTGNQEFFGNDGHLSDHGVSQYVDAYRAGAFDSLPAVVVAHVEECLPCKMSALQLHAILTDPAVERAGSVPENNEAAAPVGGYLHYAYRVAAVLAGLALIGFIIYYTITSFEGDMVVEEPQAEVPPPVLQQEPEPVPEENHVREEADRNLFAANFEPMPLYESMTARNVRSPGLQIIAPRLGAETRNRVTFEWAIRHDGPLTLTLTILNNRGDRVHQNTVTTSSYYFDGIPEPGLYYWRLETQESLLYVGKFVVPVL